MKGKVVIRDFDGKIVEKEFNIRDTEHFKLQQKFKSSVIKPKKGKGSFKRRKRVDIEED